MDMSKLETYLDGLSPEELEEAVRVFARVRGNVSQNGSEEEDLTQVSGKFVTHDERRFETRFKTEIPGTLTRLTDVRPGEKKEFSVTILDVSRRGIRLKVGVNYIPAQAVKLVFVGPRGKIKECFLEVVRLDRITENDDTWVQLGCTSIDEEKVEAIRSQDASALNMRKKLANKSQVHVYVVGPVTPETRELSQRIKGQGYQTRRMDSVIKALSEAPKTAVQLAVFTQGPQLSADPALLLKVAAGPGSVASLAIVDNDAERQTLLRAGIDECVLQKDLDEILFYAIERTLIGHAVREGQKKHSPSSRVLIMSGDSFRASMLSHQLENSGWTSKMLANKEELEGIILSEFQLVLADFDSTDIDTFKKVRRLTKGVTLVALCDDFRSAPTAQREGADNYLCVPAGEDDIRAMLKMIGSREEQLASS